jgi:CheY-like chemotaxis protein
LSASRRLYAAAGAISFRNSHDDDFVGGADVALLHDAVMPTPRFRILAVEPEASCRENLKKLLTERIGAADIVTADTTDTAAAAMRSQLPDLVTVSAVMPPRAEEQLMQLLKQLDPYGTVPVLTIPPAVMPVEERETTRGFFTLFARGPLRPVAIFDPAAVAARIGETLSDLSASREVKRRARSHHGPKLVQSSSVALAPVSARSQTRASAGALALVARPAPRELLPRRQQRRAHRLTPDELPWKCALTTPTGVVVQLLNVSATGVLFESPLKFAPDSAASLYLFGPDTKCVLPARFVRSEVSEVDALGVKYRTAATFSQKVELFSALGGSAPKPTPQALAELLVRVTADLNHRGDWTEARAAFEKGLRQILPACEVKVRDELVKPADGCDSIYFTIPTPRGAILQATFDPDHQPSIDEFNLLRAAATVASVVVQYKQPIAAARTP